MAVSQENHLKVSKVPAVYLLNSKGFGTYKKQSLVTGYPNPVRGKVLSKNSSTGENAVSQTQYGRWTL